jgi:hypothetical protein
MSSLVLHRSETAKIISENEREISEMERKNRSETIENRKIVYPRKLWRSFLYLYQYRSIGVSAFVNIKMYQRIDLFTIVSPIQYSYVCQPNQFESMRIRIQKTVNICPLLQLSVSNNKLVRMFQVSKLHHLKGNFHSLQHQPSAFN